MFRGAKAKKPTRDQMLDQQTRQQTLPASKVVRAGVRQDELDAYFEEQQQEGQCFRSCLMFGVLFVVLLLLLLKWDKESMVAGDVEVGETLSGEDADLAEKYYSMLNVNKEDTDKAQKMKEAFKQKSEELESQGAECEDCQSQLVELKTAYNALSTTVHNDFREVLNLPRRAGASQIRNAYKKAKAEAEAGFGKYELAELKEAYDIMSHPEARIYNALYGVKPPESMKHQQKTTHGGWGVDFGMGTFKYPLMKAWLEYFNSGWVEIGFFSFFFFMVAIKMWNNRHELMEKMEQMEADNR
eukprot:NODE_832_length_1300_cov_270.376499_g631_i0.p1 GENE.NODE_832_length_1300_cov_270.376499_g631_i0~~NODE_832_length_1300_cov_270.376499_g631_i0.p1  ORF type:complete len:299 (+),score=76.48 NODE_832_length_1300_cov_270.376499_g631_i0:76-972(+)